MSGVSLFAATGIAVEVLFPAGAVEGLPLSLWLRKPVSDSVKRGGIQPNADVARNNFNILGKLARRLVRQLPRDHTIGPRINGRRWHRWRLLQLRQKVRVV